ncbi:hypothetical protein DYB31_001055 [Aphanomyces astaci]|uniref:Serine-threonine/tyrosine-protein kinase catalytic domain-containing protein n=1 Tax=Aphanomyces astaci TaxID=112090 RepID=A0A397F082_APHAT|nr:hypothetical protein DYB31_001055 [Aphanomyces astaci]
MRVLVVLAAVGCRALSLFSQASVTCISVTRASRVVWVANVVVQGTLPANICRSSKVYRDDCDVIETESGCITAQFDRYSVAADIYSYGVLVSELDTHDIPYADYRNEKNQPLNDFQIMTLVRQGTLQPHFTHGCPDWGVRSRPALAFPRPPPAPDEPPNCRTFCGNSSSDRRYQPTSCKLLTLCNLCAATLDDT